AGGADEGTAGLRLDRDGRAALAPECVERDALRSGPQRQMQVVAFDRRALELVQGRVEDGREVRVRARQEVVLRGLEPGARADLSRVADDVRGEPALRV